jgi:hypothetical protein
MAVCPACGAQSPAGVRRCPACGALLHAQGLPEGGREAVAVLLCRLVERTAEPPWDPEDVDFLRERVAAVSGRVAASFGGAQQDDAGAAILALFRSRQGQEDDGAERAVRAAFCLLDEMRALRWPDGRPAQATAVVWAGEAAGPGGPKTAPSAVDDLVGAAARLLQRASPGGVWVGGAAHDLTKDVVRYSSAHRLEPSGDDLPVAAHLATAVAAPRGHHGPAGALHGPFVGRLGELAALHASLDRAVTERRSRPVLVVGETGMGKTRLINEFGARVTSAAGADDAARGVRWWRGRCRPFAGVTCQALCDVVGAHAGIIGGDDAAAVRAKLAGAVPDGPDADWIRARLGSLMGLPGPRVGRAESFAAWRAHLRGMAGDGRLVLVVEDLQWADDTMLAFLEALAREPLPVPALVLASARPGLVARDALAFAATGDVDIIQLGPLAGEDARELVAGLLGDEPPGGLEAVVDQTGGDPLCAESCARLLVERDLVVRTAGGPALPDRPAVPPGGARETLIARLDGLPRAQREVLRDAALLGGVFSRGALRALAERGAGELDRLLAQLVERGFIGQLGASDVDAGPAYGFRHDLCRDIVATELQPLERARRHRAAAAWLEARAGDRAAALAEAQAAHCTAAHRLATEAGDRRLAAAALDSALAVLPAAARHCLRLDAVAAERHLRHALELAPAGSPSRPGLLWGLSAALALRGADEEASGVAREAVAAATAAGENGVAAVAAATAGVMLARRLSEGHEETMALAEELARGAEPSPEKCEALTICAAYQGEVMAEWRTAAETAGEAVATARELGRAAPPGALGWRGLARCRIGDPGGRADLEAALAQAADEDAPEALGAGAVERQHARCLSWTEGPVAALRRSGATLGAARRRLHAVATGLRGDRVTYLSALGEWEAALEGAARLEGELEAAGDLRELIPVRAHRAVLLARRGEPATAAAAADWLRQAGREVTVQSLRSHCLLGAAVVAGLAGHTRAADELVTEWVRGWTGNDPSHAELLPDAVRAASGCADPRWLGEPLGAVLRDLPLYGLVLDTVAATRSEREGRREAALRAYSGLTRRWRDFGAPYEQGHALLGAARCLVALDRGMQATPVLERARELFLGLGARPAVAQADALRAALRRRDAPRAG